MTRLDWNETDLSFSLIAPSSSFSGSNTFATGQVTSGSQGGNALEPIVVPSAFGVWNFSGDLKFGRDAVFAIRSADRIFQDFVGRYQSLVSSISQVEVSLSAAYRMTRICPSALGR